MDCICFGLRASRALTVSSHSLYNKNIKITDGGVLNAMCEHFHPAWWYMPVTAFLIFNNYYICNKAKLELHRSAQHYCQLSIIAIAAELACKVHDPFTNCYHSLTLLWVVFPESSKISLSLAPNINSCAALFGCFRCLTSYFTHPPL